MSTLKRSSQKDISFKYQIQSIKIGDFLISVFTECIAQSLNFLHTLSNIYNYEYQSLEILNSEPN